MELKDLIKPVPNFPKEGITFQDISGLLANQDAINEIIIKNIDYYGINLISKIVGIESRGFILGGILANNLHVPFVLGRKSKLPPPTYKTEFTLEYGNASIEIQQNALTPDDIVMIHDDILATGGTSLAIAKMLVEKFKIKQENVYLNYMIDLTYIQTDIKKELFDTFNCFSTIKL